MATATVAVTLCLAAIFLLSGAGKIVGSDRLLRARDHLGVPPRLWFAIGVLELAGAAGVLIGLSVEALGVLAASGLALLGLGALGSHLRARDGVVDFAPAVLAAGLSVALVAMQVGR